MSKKTARQLIADSIRIRGAKQNNLKGIDLDLPLGKLNVITGPSGSGKSSLAFDTIYAEGQRRYVETFSPYTRQFFERMDKPKVDSIEGIPPAIAIEQVNNMRSTRSTVGTITEINDYLKMIFPRLAEATCPGCKRPVRPETPESIVRELLSAYADKQALILFPVPVPKNAVTADFAAFLQSQGFVRVWLYGNVIRLDDAEALKGRKLPAQVLVVQDRVALDAKQRSRLSEALEAALRYGKGKVAVNIDDETRHFSTDWSCADCGITLPTPTPGLFSFNSPIGACPTCRGFGRTLGIDIGKAIPDESLSINLGLVRPFQGSTYGESQLDLERAARKRGIDIHKAFDDYTPEERHWLIEGTDPDPEVAYNRGEWYGVRGFFKWMESRSYKMHVRVFLSRYRAYTECGDCGGGRLKKEAYAFRIGPHTIADLWRMPVSELHPLVQTWPLKEGDHAAKLLRDEIASRVSYMDRAGLGYLNLDRQTRTLSGGELQRVNLTTCLGASLVNTLFVLDEPSIGLHPRDIGRLIGVMEGLRDKGNTLLVVEHEEAVMQAADNLIDIGPGRGEKGGELVFNGPLEKLSKTKGSLTGDYLFGRKNIPVPTHRRPINSVTKVNPVTPENPLDLPALSDDESRSRAYAAILQPHPSDPSLRDRSGKAAPSPHPCAEELHRGADQESFGWARRSKRERLLDDQLAILNRHATAPADLGTHIGGGGEHEVYHRQGSHLVHKATNRGEFGYVIDQDSDNKSNKLTLRHALPSEYLLRLGTQNLLFGDTIRVEAIAKEKGKTASIITSQVEVDLGRPTQAEVNEFMTQCGFARVPDDMMLSQYSNKFFWYRAADSVLTGDTNPENFSRAADNIIVPIDVIAHPYPRALFESTAKQNGISLTHFKPAHTKAKSARKGQLETLSLKLGTLSIRSARQNNLRKLDADIPLNAFVCITGVSGSGKSTLVHDVLYRNLQRLRGEVCEDEPGRVGSISGWEQLGSVVMVDQSPLARTPRSTPAVFTGAFDHIRTLFAACDDAATQGIMPGFFSFNSGEGRCERCMGNGFEKIEMQFLSDLFVTCPECEGKRYKPHALKILLNGKSIHDVLSMTIEDAVPWFASIEHRAVAAINRSLQLVIDAGLGYLRLGQPLNTLSGGEAQRLKLVGHLLEPQTPGKSSLLLLDEPTTGLHFDDIALLIKLLQRLVDEGNSLVVIEHNLEVIKCADWVLDLGPEGGAGGGSLVIAGTPEDVADCSASHTGQYLRDLLFQTTRERPGVLQPSGAFRGPDDARKRQRTGALQDAGASNAISIRGAREHNLKNISLDIPRDEFVVVTGLSGSGKSSLAFDLIFAEGQRRFLDSMSVYARTFVEQMEKPEVDLISGVPPTVAIEQRISRGGGKSTVATVTEVYHFLRLLFAKLGTQFCPKCAVAVKKQSSEAILKTIQGHLRTSGGHLLAPLIKARKGFHTDVAENAAKHGIETLWVDGEFKPTMGFKRLERFKEHSIDAVIAKVGKGENADVLRPHIETALKMGKGTIKLRLTDKSMHMLSTEMSCPSCGWSFEELDPRLFSFNSPHGWCKDCRGFGYVGQKRDLNDRNADVSMLEAELEEERRFNSDDDENAAPRQLCPTCNGSRINEIGRAVQLQKSTIQDFASLTAGEAGKLIAKLKFEGTEAIIARDIVKEIEQRLKFMQEVGLGYLQLNRSADTLSGGEAQRIRLSAQLGSNLRGVLYVLDEPTIGLHPRDNEKLLNTLTALRDKGNSLLVVEHDDETMKRADTILDLGPGAGKFGGEVVAQGTLAHLLKAKQSVTGQSLKHPLKHPSRGTRRPLPEGGIAFPPNSKAKGPAKPKDQKNGQEYNPALPSPGWLRVTGATANNLKSIDVSIPLGRLTVLTGVSGSGKSSFMHGALSPAVREKISKAKIKVTKAWKTVSGFENLQTVHEVDQSPIGKTSRSCPATYVGILDDIRALFAQVPLARTRGYTASRFSFNTEGGRCETCGGNGEIKVEMAFLPTTRVHCETCHGLRFNAATLEIEYNGKHIGDVLRMSITEAAEFFAPVQKIARPLKLLADTGLGYLQLGQPSPTLSGGEAQRIKLVTELRSGDGKTIKEQLKGIQKAGKRNLYLIEEPTIGLHIRDVARLIDVLHRLVDEGHTVVVIEHHPDVYAEADYLIDIGPEAGTEGGQLVAAGTPEEVKKNKVSRTARFL